MTDTMSTLDDAKQWRDRAEEMRIVAEGMQSESNKSIALRLAADYDRLAMHAERRAERSLDRQAAHASGAPNARPMNRISYSVFGIMDERG